MGSLAAPMDWFFGVWTQYRERSEHCQSKAFWHTEVYNLGMTHRLNVIEELRVRFDVAYSSDRGETFDYIDICLNECRHGVDISYVLLDLGGENLDNVFPSEGVDVLALTAKNILYDLGVKPKRLVLQLWEFGINGRTSSMEGRAPVNRTRDTVLLMLTKTPFLYKFGHDLMLWHQGCHAKDRWEYRFPSAHPLVEMGAWLDALWHFSVDGRLENWGRPHYSREERVAEAARIFQESAKLTESSALELAVRLCDDLWGREVTQDQLVTIASEAGLTCTRP